MTERPRPSYDRAQSASDREAEQRARIVTVASEAYVLNGYYSTTVEDIALRARMSRRTIYTHFRTLDDLRFAVFEKAVQETLLEVGRTLMVPADDRLRDVLCQAFGQIVAKPNLARVVMFELRRPEPRNVELRHRILAFFVSGWAEAHAHDVAAESAPYAVDEETLYALVGAVEGMAVRYLESEHPERALDAVPVLLKIIRAVYPFRQRG